MAKWDLVAEQLTTITKMAREGNTETEIIEYLKIGRKTFYKYKKEHPELAEALMEGYRTSLEKVEAALYKAALGYSYEEVTKERDRNGNMIETKRVKKEVQPNVSAIMNILKNKRTEDWNVADKIDVAAEIKNNSVDLSDFSKDDLLKLIGGDEDE
jgi:hypothetical protein